ncbi:MAG: two-component system response regulator [Bacteriovoracaceae bacterium]|jgi:two-component system response regulator
MKKNQFDSRPAEILLIEDEQADIDLISRAFEKSKISNNLSFVRNGEEALEFLRKEGAYSDVKTPDIVLLDLNMPKMSGREILVQVKSDESLKMIPIIVLTSSDAEEDIVKSYQLGANCYIQKPIDLNEVNKIILSLENFWFSIVTLATVDR